MRRRCRWLDLDRPDFTTFAVDRDEITGLQHQRGEGFHFEVMVVAHGCRGQGKLRSESERSAYPIDDGRHNSYYCTQADEKRPAC